MTFKNLITPVITLIISSCASIPKEAVTLSQTLGSDLKILHTSHVGAVDIYFDKIKDDINYFIDEKYTPFVIHYVLKAELADYNEGNRTSLYGTIEIAGQKEGAKESNDAMTVMKDFLDAARTQIEGKRKELLFPLEEQEAAILQAVNQSYENAIYASSSITAYLQSIRRLKESRQEALSKVGLEGTDTRITDSLVKLSAEINKAVQEAKKIDIQSDDAYQQLEKVTDQIKKITNKK